MELPKGYSLGPINTLIAEPNGSLVAMIRQGGLVVVDPDMKHADAIAAFSKKLLAEKMHFRDIATRGVDGHVIIHRQFLTPGEATALGGWL